MPIRPENRARYPKTWAETSRRLRFERAGGRCECTGQCGLHAGRRCIERHGEPAVYARGKIVLTVAHLDHQPENCDDANLLVCCQRCHNRIDVESRRAGIEERRREKRLAEIADQMDIWLEQRRARDA